MEASRERTDGDLLAAFADGGDQSAFGELVQRYGSMVYGVCLRVVRDHHEAEDAAQAVFLTLARKAASLRRDPSVGGWLHTVARRLAKDVRNARYRREAREDRAMRDQMIQDRQESDLGGFREQLDEAIGVLPERYRLPLVLFHLRGCSLEQTASQLRLNANTASTRLARAREMLRRKLVRRGVTVGTVGALTALLSAEAGAAVLPASFVSATAKAAGLAAAGQLAAGVGTGIVSANVAALTKGAANMLFWSSVKTAVVAVAVTGAVVTTGTVVAQKAMDANPSVGVASKRKTEDLRNLVRLRREGNLLACDWVCPTNPADLGRFETLNPRLSCVADLLPTQTFGPGAAEIYGTNMAERAGSGIWHFRMRANAANSNFWVMVMYGTKAPIACIEYIQSTNQLRLIRTVWTADGRLDPDRSLAVRTGPNIEELKAKAGDELRTYLAPVLAMITPEDLIGPFDELPDYEMGPYSDFTRLSSHEQEALRKADEAFQTRKYDEATRLYESCLRDYPKSLAVAYALVLRGRCRDKIGDFLPAAKAYDEVLDYFPANITYAAPSLFYKARISVRGKDFARAKQLLAQLEKDREYSKHDVMPVARRLKAVIEKMEGPAKTVTTFSEADNGKTVAVPVGQLFEVHLTNDREGAGWEPGATEIAGKSVMRVDNLRRMNCDEFVPADPSTNSTKGTYIYRYKAATTGESNLRLTHLYPSGPKPVPRTATLFIGEFKLTVVVADRDQAGRNSAGDKALDGPALAAAVKGDKVLVKFWHYPLVDHPNRPTDAEIADGRKNTGGEITQALNAANVEVVRFLWGQDGKEGADRSSYAAMALLDCKGRRPEEALASVPYRVAGIVFKDGVYERALPVETESKWLVTAKKGQVPAPHAFYHRGGSYGDIQQGKEDVERFRTIPGVHVEAFPPPSGASGGGWRARMTPTPGHTLLEVFLLTETGFELADPGQTAGAPTAAPESDHPARAKLDPTRLESAPVVVRVRVKPHAAGMVGSVGPFMTQFTTLVVTEVLKDRGGRGPKAGAEIGLAHDQREPLPAGEFTAYLKPEVLKLAGGEHVRYIFTGAVAQGAKYPGARLGTSHAVAEK